MKTQPVSHHKHCEYMDFPSSQCKKTAFKSVDTTCFYYNTPVIIVFFTKSRGLLLLLKVLHRCKHTFVFSKRQHLYSLRKQKKCAESSFECILLKGNESYFFGNIVIYSYKLYNEKFNYKILVFSHFFKPLPHPQGVKTTTISKNKRR